MDFDANLMSQSTFLCKIIAIVFLTCLISMPAHADLSRPLQRAQKALSEGDYAKAYPLYLDAAQHKDNALAKFTLALFYANGWGRPVDASKACQWYAQAAPAGIPAAAHFLGECFRDGIHQPHDYKKALHWFEQAAQLGHHLSLCSTAQLYFNGEGVAKDISKAIGLCEQAAQRGVVPAMAELAKFYLVEASEHRDEQAARHWYLMGAQRKSAAAQFHLAQLLQDGIGGPKDSLGARTWFETAASQGYVPAYFRTASLYFHAPVNPQTGMWTEQDLAKAYLWLSATLRSETNQELRDQAQQMLDKVVAVMPKSWHADLDAKVIQHFTTYPAKPLQPVNDRQMPLAPNDAAVVQ